MTELLKEIKENNQELIVSDNQILSVELDSLFENKNILSNYSLNLKPAQKATISIDESEQSSGSREISFYIKCAKNSVLNIDLSAKDFPVNAGGKTTYNFLIDVETDAKVNMTLIERVCSDIQTNVKINLNGKKAYAYLNAISSLNNSEKLQRKIDIHHNVSECYSNQLFRNALNGKSYSFIDTSVNVAENTTKSLSEQLVNSILLSDEARAVSKPILLIYHDDVECSHGATCGQLDKESLFFLESRGLSRVQSRRILLRSFMDEALEFIPSKRKVLLNEQIINHIDEN